MQETGTESSDRKGCPSADASGECVHAGWLDWPQGWVLLLSASAVVASALQIGLGRVEAGLFVLVLTLGVYIVGSWFDAATWRIPNALTYTAILIGLGVNAAATGAELAGTDLLLRWTGGPGAVEALKGFGACALIGLLCLYAGGLGGGDMKLIAALGALLGWQAAAHSLLYALVVAVAFALVNLVWQGRLTRLLQDLAWALLLSRALGQRPQLGTAHKSVPLAIPLLVGVILAHTGLPALTLLH